MNEIDDRQTVNVSLNEPASAPTPEVVSDRKDRTEDGRRLPDPFTQKDIQREMHLTSGGSNSQVRRWIYWGWVETAGFGAYRRTATYGGVKASQHKKLNTAHQSYPVSTRTGHQLACDFPGCNYVGYGKTPPNAARSVGKHKNLVHGIKKRYISAAERDRLGYAPGTKYGYPAGVNNGAPVAPAPAAVTTAEPVDDLPFCPGCGLSLMMHRTAYRIAKKHSRKD